MEQLLCNKRCIVTGGSRGIGRMITRRFAQEGAIVYATSRNEGSFDDWLKEEPEDTRIKIHPLYFDITDTDSIRENLLKVKREEGQLDIIVNNAAIEFNEIIGMISKSNMEKMFQTNVYGTIQMLQYGTRIMTQQKKGSIINIASVVGIYGNPGQLVYSATKGAIIALTKSAAKELAAKGIRVNAVAPGLTKTDMLDNTSSSLLDKRMERISMNRFAEPIEIANTCLFLASDLSSYISGQIIGVDGCTVM